MTDQLLPEELHRRQSAALDRFRTHLQRWSIDVSSTQERAWDAQKIGSEFSRLALQSAFIVNGGALIALPPLMQWLATDERALVPYYAILFVTGLLLAAISAIVAYFNFMQLSVATYAQGAQRAMEINAQFEGRTIANDDANYENEKAKEHAANRIVTGTLYAALTIGIASYVCFGVGAYSFISLAMLSSHETVTKTTNSPVSVIPSGASKAPAVKPTPASPASPPRR